MYLDKLKFKKDILLFVDPRCRFLGSIVIIFATINISNVYFLSGLIFIFAFLMIREIKLVLLRLVPVNIFVLFLFITLILSVEKGFYSGLVYFLRVNSAALIFIFMVSPMGIGKLANTMSKTGLPKKLVAIFILTYRYIYTLYDRIFVSISSMNLRKQNINTIMIWRTYSAIFATSFINSFLLSKKINNCMIKRGFDGEFPITMEFKWKKTDSILIAVIILISLALWFGDKWIN